MLNIGFLEEILFRGFLFKMMEKDNVRSAIIVREDNGQAGYRIPGIDKSYRVDNITTNPKILTKQPGGYCYKLKWKGDTKI